MINKETELFMGILFQRHFSFHTFLIFRNCVVFKLFCTISGAIKLEVQPKRSFLFNGPKTRSHLTEIPLLSGVPFKRSFLRLSS